MIYKKFKPYKERHEHLFEIIGMIIFTLSFMLLIELLYTYFCERSLYFNEKRLLKRLIEGPPLKFKSKCNDEGLRAINYDLDDDYTLVYWIDEKNISIHDNKLECILSTVTLSIIDKRNRRKSIEIVEGYEDNFFNFMKEYNHNIKESFMIVTDSHFTIGKGHLICEDYAKCGKINDFQEYIIISDGCSSSENSDIGARLNTLALENYLKENKYYLEEFNDNSVGYGISYLSNSYAKYLHLNPTCLDSTVIFAYYDHHEKNLQCRVLGDGVVFYKRRDVNSPIRYINVDFEKQAPYYPSYMINDERKDLYKDFAKNFNYETKHITYDSFATGAEETRSFRYDSITSLSFDKNDPLEFIGIASDGINTFVKKHVNGNVEKIPLSYIIEELCKFDTINKSFVKRRMKVIKDKLQKEMIYHYDDLSVAMMYFK